LLRDNGLYVQGAVLPQIEIVVAAADQRAHRFVLLIRNCWKKTLSGFVVM